MNTWKKFWMAPLFFLPSLVCGWNSIGPLTHERITDDAINLINSTTPMEFPDAERFSEELRDGSETEAQTYLD